MKIFVLFFISLILETQGFAMNIKDCENLMNEKEALPMAGSARLVQLATGFMETAIQETLEQLTHGLEVAQAISVNELVNAHSLEHERFQRFLFAAKSLGLVEFTDLKSFSLQTDLKKYSDVGSKTLFWIVSSGLAVKLSHRAENLSTLIENGFDAKKIELALKFKIIEKKGEDLFLAHDLEPLLNPSSASYMGLWIRNYDRINSKVFTKDNLISAIQTGKTRWSATFGANVTNPFDLAKVDPVIFADLMEGMHQSNIAENEILAKSLDIKEEKTILDIGGASGAWALTLAQTFPSIKKISIYELDTALPLYIEMYNRYRAEKDYPIEFVGGNFFSKTKDDALKGLRAEDKFDAITLGWIIHDWQDVAAIEILRKARHHLAANGRIFMLEAILPKNRIGRSTFLDLTMLVQTGGKERTLSDFEQLAAAAGLVVSKTVPSNTRRQIIELKVR